MVALRGGGPKMGQLFYFVGLLRCFCFVVFAATLRTLILPRCLFFYNGVASRRLLLAPANTIKVQCRWARAHLLARRCLLVMQRHAGPQQTLAARRGSGRPLGRRLVPPPQQSQATGWRRLPGWRRFRLTRADPSTDARPLCRCRWIGIVCAIRWCLALRIPNRQSGRAPASRLAGRLGVRKQLSSLILRVDAHHREPACSPRSAADATCGATDDLSDAPPARPLAPLTTRSAGSFVLVLHACWTCSSCSLLLLLLLRSFPSGGQAFVGRANTPPCMC